MKFLFSGLLLLVTSFTAQAGVKMENTKFSVCLFAGANAEGVLKSEIKYNKGDKTLSISDPEMYKIVLDENDEVADLQRIESEHNSNTIIKIRKIRYAKKTEVFPHSFVDKKNVLLLFPSRDSSNIGLDSNIPLILIKDKKELIGQGSSLGSKTNCDYLKL